jgi:hypothetical protein
MSKSPHRANYSSGEDFVLEYGDLKFTFNEDDFAGRVECAARKLGLVREPLDESELADLVTLTVNGTIEEPQSQLAYHVLAHSAEFAANPNPETSLVHWLRRVVFRGTWLDQRLIEGELDVALNAETGDFSYIFNDTPADLPPKEIQLAPSPDWSRLAYDPK